MQADICIAGGALKSACFCSTCQHTKIQNIHHSHWRYALTFVPADGRPGSPALLSASASLPANWALSLQHPAHPLSHGFVDWLVADGWFCSSSTVEVGIHYCCLGSRSLAHIRAKTLRLFADPSGLSTVAARLGSDNEGHKCSQIPLSTSVSWIGIIAWPCTGGDKDRKREKGLWHDTYERGCA